MPDDGAHAEWSGWCTASRARRTRRVGCVLVACASISFAARAVRADLDTYPFEGFINEADIGVLFGSKQPGQTFAGSFTIDTQAMLLSVGSGGQSTTWSGDFAVVVEGASIPVVAFTVWSSGPGGASDGFEFAIQTAVGTGFLSLRSDSDIYTQPLLPTYVDIAEMDSLAQLSVGLGPPFFDYDRGTLTFVPEAEAAWLGAAAVVALAGARRRAARSSRWT